MEEHRSQGPIMIAGLIALIVIGVGGWFAIQQNTDIPDAELSLADAPLPPSVEMPEEKLVKILFLGDMMLDRAVRRHVEEKGVLHPFNKIGDWFSRANLIIANAEGPFTENESVAKPNGLLKFTFATSTLPVLKSIGFTAFSQANNHTRDFGKEGEEASRAFIEAAGIISIGDYFNEQSASILGTEVGDIAFIGYNEFGGNRSNVIAEIEKQDSETFTVVLSHWGPEYVTTIPPSLPAIAHSFIDAGADLIIGTHPHVIEPIEIYKNRPIFYSLGNFIFDQDFSPETKEGLAVGVSLEENTVSYSLMPFDITEAQAIPKPDEAKAITLQKIEKGSVGFKELTPGILSGGFVLIR